MRPLPDKEHEQIRMKKSPAENLFKRVQDFNDDLHKKTPTEAVRETALKSLQQNESMGDASENEEVKVIKKKRIPKSQIRKLSAKSKAQMEMYEE